MRGLKFCLWILGIACLLGLPALFLPMSTLEAWANVFGEGSFPEGPLFAYMVRAVLATYAGIGGFFVILALDPRRYGVLVPYAGVVAVFLALVFAMTGLLVGLPVLWYAIDAVCTGILGLLVLVCWAGLERAGAAPPAEGR